VARTGKKGEEDADIVTHMKNAGAILIGVSNIPELNLWCESRNNIYHQTRNPYNIYRTVSCLARSSLGEHYSALLFWIKLVQNHIKACD